MCFKCQSCGVPQEARVKPHKVVTEIRTVKYPPVKENDGRIKYVPEGWEIVKELDVCPNCFETKKFGYKVVDSKVVRERMEIY